jgi:hypothetical protein
MYKNRLVGIQQSTLARFAKFIKICQKLVSHEYGKSQVKKTAFWQEYLQEFKKSAFTNSNLETIFLSDSASKHIHNILGVYNLLSTFISPSAPSLSNLNVRLVEIDRKISLLLLADYKTAWSHVRDAQSAFAAERFDTYQ